MQSSDVDDLLCMAAEMRNTVEDRRHPGYVEALNASDFSKLAGIDTSQDSLRFLDHGLGNAYGQAIAPFLNLSFHVLGIYKKDTACQGYSASEFNNLNMNRLVVHAFGGFHDGFGNCRVRVHRVAQLFRS